MNIYLNIKQILEIIILLIINNKDVNDLFDKLN